MITLAILALLTLAIAMGTFLAKKRQRAAQDRGDIPLFAVSVASLVPPPRPVVKMADTPPSFETVTRTPVSGNAPEQRPDFQDGPPAIRMREGAVSTLSKPYRDQPLAASPDENVGDPVDGVSVRYWRAADGTLQFLPGRLVIATGRDAGHEIRFVRTSGPDATLVTFGRAEGAPYRHVQLREPTVSRVHARMTLDLPGTNSSASRGTTGDNAPRWHLQNLSSTNPVVVNGAPLDAGGGRNSSVVLSDGDRIEMGEVAFVFHAR